MQNNVSFLAMVEQPSMIVRLGNELREALREFREAPKAYVTSALKGEARGGRRGMLLRVGLAIAILFYAIAFVSMLVFWSLAHNRAQATPSGNQSLVLLKLPGYWPKIDTPTEGDRSGGGGGGGRHTITEPSIGVPPVSSLTQLVVAPRPEAQLTPPVLPFIEKVMVDPRIQLDRDDLSPTGLPDGVGVTPSAGPGSDRGMGTGSGGGMGPGGGDGVGPGVGGNTGDEWFKLGKRRPAGAVAQQAVDERPVLLNQPRPLFTEEARSHKIQGVVRVRILVDANGRVTEVVVTRGLPDGLNEQAIRAAYQMRFKPAMKNGRPVLYWLSNVEVEFNLR
jgi:protein TonB